MQAENSDSSDDQLPLLPNVPELDVHILDEPSNESPSVLSNDPATRLRDLVRFYMNQLTLLFYPLLVTFGLICWLETTLNMDPLQESGESNTDEDISMGDIMEQLGSSIIYALSMVLGIAMITMMFVLCFKYRFYKVMFLWLGFSVLSILGVTVSTIWIELMEIFNLPIDWITFVACMWNFSVVGIIAIFWSDGPLWLQQAYLIFISTATAISLLRLPPWTVWTVLVAIAVYDVFAVLCPGGPLKLLLDIAEERDEDVPALIYTAGMASLENTSETIGIYHTEETPCASSSKKPWTLFNKKKSGYERIIGEEGDVENSINTNSVNTHIIHNSSDGPFIQEGRESESEVLQEEDWNSVKLGLGDFIFYGVLIGRAAATDAITVCSCIISIFTGLSLTILILTVKQQPLPALPISILFGSLTYAIGSYITTNMVIHSLVDGVIII
ncbi:Presenilin-domain-containing protein [Phycomyces blakesleeanus]|uniref:Presenilin-domain-containing protein n=1 Tax=Phycomyces blakesleeanus TaxID=4837 RepID=A0ABR3BA37_PHYBL